MFQKNKIISYLFILMLLGFIFTISASSPDAWEEYRQDVLTQCAKEFEGELINPHISVDPFGTESFGIAHGIGKTKYSSDIYIATCVYHKQSLKTELSFLLKLNNIPSYKKLLDENIQLKKRLLK